MVDKNIKNEKSPAYQIVKFPVSDHSTRKQEHSYVYNGSTIGLWFSGFYFYWGKNISSVAALTDKVQKRIRISITLIFLILDIICFLIWGLSVYKVGILEISNPEYWVTINTSLVFFWLGLLGLLYLYFRYVSFREKDIKVLQKRFEQKDSDKYFEPDLNQVGKKNRIELSKVYSNNALNAIYDAHKLAKDLGHKDVMPIHLLGVLPEYNNVAVMFGRLGILGNTLQDKLIKALAYYPSDNKKDNSPNLSIDLHKVMLRAYIYAYQAGLEKVTVVDLFISIVMTDPEKDRDIIQELLDELEITDDKVKNIVEWMHIRQRLAERYKRFRSLARFKPKGDVNRAMTAIATKNLDAFSEDLTRLAAYEYLMPCIGRNEEIEEIFRTIEGTGKSVLLIGHNGIGKQSIIEGIAQLMVTEDVPEVLQDKRLVSLRTSQLVGGVNAASAQDRLIKVLNEAILSGNIVISINDIEDMVGITVGGESSLDLAQVLADSIKSRRIFAIATTNPQSYSKYIEGTSLADSFNVIHIDQMTINEAIQVVEMKVGALENKNSVYFSYDAIAEAVKLSDRYLHDKYLPEKAIDIVEEAAVYVRNNKKASKIVTTEDIAHIISNRTNIPLTSINQEESDKLLNLEELMHERIVGQDEAVKIVATSMQRARTELRDKDKPIANLLFLGPTGVGKTELAKTLADIYFGSESRMLRFDMSEYQEKSSIDRLIGTLNNPGHLTEAVRKNPFSLVLFDELEKAHPDILNIFLQMMDDGRLTDGMGRTVDFSNTIIIATSNAGTSYIQEQISKGETDLAKIKDTLMKVELKQYYRPEFLNRFDNIVVFKPLEYEEIVKIAELLLKKVAKRLEDKGIHFEATSDAIIELAEAGYDPEFGARPLRRAIQEHVDNTLAKHLLAGKIGKRDKVVLQKDGEILINKASKL